MSEKQTSEEERHERWNKWWRGYCIARRDMTLTGIGMDAFEYQEAHYYPLLAAKDALISDLHRDIIRKDKEAVALAEQIDRKDAELAVKEAENQTLKEQIALTKYRLEERYAELAAIKKEKEGYQKVIGEVSRIVEESPELNMGNYDPDQVHKLNNAMIEIALFLRRPILEAAESLNQTGVK
jgi:hypothetical protein